jgi:mannose-1-phosphate guanylyltransferase
MNSSSKPASAVVPVILSGGAGSRLWPVSRQGHPKPFIELPDGQTLLHKTLLRAATVASVQRLLLVTNRDYYFISKDEVGRAFGAAARPVTDFLLEPFGRNTAAAVAAAAHWVVSHVGADAVMLILPADHLITPAEEFSRDVQAAVALAQRGKMVTFGVRPTRPETAYGYIECGERFAETKAKVVRRFVEKPDLAKARDYSASPDFLWNSGMFCMQAQIFLDELQRHRPELGAAMARTWEAARPEAGRLVELPAEQFEQVEDISIDYAVMEHSDKLVVLPTEASWNDIGSWNSMAALSPADANGNRVLGDAVVIDCTNCYVHADERIIATLGVSGLMVVDTPDALLVAAMDQDQQVKDIVAQLKLRGHESYRTHRTVIRPWGTYTVLEEGGGYKIKRIEVKPQGALSLQMHHHRSEHWIVVSGTAKVMSNDREFLVMTNESTYIPAGHKHRVENPGVVDLVMIEVQSGDYLGEDDIVRFSDIYGRT